MDFFEQQDRAKRNTLRLIFIFAMAVVLIIVAIYAVLAYLFLTGKPPPTAEADWLSLLKRHWDRNLFAATAIGTLAIVAAGTLYKMALLSAGGEAVARMFGAIPINPQTTEPAERRLLNIVEEMAIASGIPVPRVYLLDENSINAFAAGFSTRDAVIGVTRGCMTLLSRDELQGVIAHEFSHVLNGDMRLNLRLMGVLHGILIISLIGYWIFRITSQPSRSGSARKKDGNTLPIILAGLCLMIIGYIGVFFARIIKAAVSRQREFLADAASIQFTRNPEGIAGALKKIGGFMQGGLISHPAAEAASHLFFADGIKHAFFDLMSTHPPLVERIRRIDPSFDGAFPPSTEIKPVAVENETSIAGAPVSSLSSGARAPVSSIKLNTDEALKLVGRTDPESLNNTARWFLSLPDSIRAAAREPSTAQALIMAMLISRAAPIRANQLTYLKQNADSALVKNLLELMPVVDSLPPESFLPLSDLTTATLRTMRTADLKTFASLIQRVVEADGSITLFEYMIQARIKGQINSWSRRLKIYDFSAPGAHYYWPAMRVILSTLAYYGNKTDPGASASYDEGLKTLPCGKKETILPKNQCGLQHVDRALATLEAASGKIKRIFLEACCACVAHDGRVNSSEAELLRAVAAGLDCPVPPFLPTEMN